MTRASGTDIWHWTIRLRHDWHGTYDLFVDEGDGPEPGSPDYWRCAPGVAPTRTTPG